jgi:tRNA dimethylallyltransferase
MRHPRSESGSASNAAKKPVIFLLGPTAVGKSELGLALAHRIDAEIISADSMQIYRGMDIGTAKPSKQARFRVRHHLLDLRAPSREFSAHEYRLKALHALQVISSRGKMPLVIGGSGLYVRALIEGLSGQPGKNTAYRRRLEAEIKVRGIARLYRRLEKIDAATASSIDPRNQRRVIRALEIYQQSKQAPTAWYRNRETLEFLGYQPILFGLERDREVLYDRITKELIKCFDVGWLRK